MREKITFRDRDFNLYYITISDINRISIVADFADYCGQLYNMIKPRTETQAKFIELWKKWRFESPNQQFIDEITPVIAKIREEETELTKSFETVFDMSGDFEPNRQHILKVCDFLDCDEGTAAHFIVIGMSLERTVGELAKTFKRESDNIYTAEGWRFYVGLKEELEEKAVESLINDSDCWKCAVQNGTTTLGLTKWAENVVRNDGFEHVLDRASRFEQCFINGYAYYLCTE